MLTLQLFHQHSRVIDFIEDADHYELSGAIRFVMYLDKLTQPTSRLLTALASKLAT